MAANTRRLKPHLPRRYLLNPERRADYLKFAVPLYEASIKCDWKAAKVILDMKPELVRFSITENSETALHVAASVNGPKHVEFVKNLVEMMEEDDLALENENFNTAVYLAAAAGNVETVKIMVKKNRKLLIIPGAMGQLMPLYAAAMYGKYEVVKYLYDNSNELCDDGWKPQTRGWLLEKCVEADMFDVALQIVKKYPELGNGSVLANLAWKPDAFRVQESNIIMKPIKLVKNLIYSMFVTHQPSENKHPEPGSERVYGDVDQKPERVLQKKSNILRRTIRAIFALNALTLGAYKKESEALQLLKIIWEDIAKKPKNEIDKILRGSPDSKKQTEKVTSKKVVEVLQLRKLISEHLDKMDVETKNIISGPQDAIKEETEKACRKVHPALQLQKLICEHLVNMHVETQNMIKEDNKRVPGQRDQAMKLQKLIAQHIVTMHVNTQNIIQRESRLEDQVQNTLFSGLFIAAEMGNTNFLVELIRQYPDVIRKVNDNNQTIFHIAVEHRHEGIYNLLNEIGAMKDMITSLRDEDENNMLHFAAKSAKKKQLEYVSGAALRMQRELLWFKEVRNMIPPSLRERKNKDGLTPRQLFTEEHKDLIREGEKWMKGTASQCMVVATLIATIVFAAALTVPGGYNQNTGIPLFYQKLTFVVFVVADAISLFLSSTSMLTFLSILTSPFGEYDFMESLPRKLMLGLTTLFLSITTMMITFSVSFFVLYHNEMKWIPVLIGLFAIIPVLLYVALQYQLLIDVIRSTYGSKYLFKPGKRVLYYKNPRV